MMLVNAFAWAWIGRWFASDQVSEIWRYYMFVALATCTTAGCLNRLSTMQFTRYAAGEPGRKKEYNWASQKHRIEWIKPSQDGMLYRMLVRPFEVDPMKEVEPFYLFLHRHEIALLIQISNEDSNPHILPIREGMKIWREDSQLYIDILNDEDKEKFRLYRRRMSIMNQEVA